MNIQIYKVLLGVSASIALFGGCVNQDKLKSSSAESNKSKAHTPYDGSTSVLGQISHH